VVLAPATHTLRQPYQQTVIAAPDRVIVIEPSQPDVVYVPRYDPWVAYGEAVPIYPGYRYQPAPATAAGICWRPALSALASASRSVP